MQGVTVRRRVGNRVFLAVLWTILVLFLAGVALLLASNVFYLAGGTGRGESSGWQVLIGSLRDPETRFAVKLSVVTSLITTVLCMVVAVPAAYLLSRCRPRVPAFVDTLLDLPIVVPPPVIGISLLLLFQTAPGRWLEMTTGEWVYTQRGIILAQFFIACSFGIRAVMATFDTIGTRHEDVARTLGCTRRQAFFRVVLPMARSGILAGAIMTWARAIAEFGPVLFFCGATRWKTEVMPIAMFLNFSVGRIEQSIALVLIMILIAAATLITFKKLGGQGYLW